jgi:hypothetical protein
MVKRRKQRSRKPRTTTVFLDMGRPVALTSARVNELGELIVESKNGREFPLRAHVESTYPRRKSDKVLHRVGVPSGRVAHDPNVALSTFLWVVAVDTNRDSETGNTYTGVVQARVTIPEIGKVELGVTRDIVFELAGVFGDPERIGWWFVISGMGNRPPEARIGVLVDSHFSDLDGINSRQQPVVGPNFLPEGFELIYASSDVGAEYFANQLLRRADRQARQVMELVRKGQLTQRPTAAPANAPFLSVRQWEAGPRAAN